MDILEQLGLAVGLASLAGVNLYLTVLLTGLLVRFNVLHLADKWQHLDVLAHPMVLSVAGVLFVLEFFADKVPWVDSLWDSVHTVIRPVGGTLLALQALGDMDPWMQVTAAMLAGGATLTTHSAKAGTRLLINHSPEPFTNVTMSVAEDAAVVGGSFFVLLQPVLALLAFGIILIALWMVYPRLFRSIRASLWFAWNKLRMPGRREPFSGPVKLPKDVDGDLLAILATHAATSEQEVAWTAPCVTGKCKGVRGLGPNYRAALVAKTSGNRVYLVTRKRHFDRLFELPLVAAKVEVESRFLSDDIIVESAGQSVTLRFPRGQSDLTETVALRLKECTGKGDLPEPDPRVEEELLPAPAL